MWKLIWRRPWSTVLYFLNFKIKKREYFRGLKNMRKCIKESRKSNKIPPPPSIIVFRLLKCIIIKDQEIFSTLLVIPGNCQVNSPWSYMVRRNHSELRYQGNDIRQIDVYRSIKSIVSDRSQSIIDICARRAKGNNAINRLYFIICSSVIPLIFFISDCNAQVYEMGIACTQRNQCNM